MNADTGTRRIQMHSRKIKPFVLVAFLLLGLALLVAGGQAQKSDSTFTPTIPKTWDESALTDWATPVAGLNIRPTHISAREYYSLPVENLRTYPAYFPGREPNGYWEMLLSIGPKPLIEPEKLRSEA